MRIYSGTHSSNAYYWLLAIWVGLVMFYYVIGPTNPDALRVVEQQGFSNVQETGFRPFACATQDVWRTGFAATAPNGDKVTGTVCEGFLKSKTVRFD